jgi:hypothetical protein
VDFDHTLKTGFFFLEIFNFHPPNVQTLAILGVESSLFCTILAQIGGMTLRCRGGDASWVINPTDSS